MANCWTLSDNGKVMGEGSRFCNWCGATSLWFSLCIFHFLPFQALLLIASVCPPASLLQYNGYSYVGLLDCSSRKRRGRSWQWGRVGRISREPRGVVEPGMVHGQIVWCAHCGCLRRYLPKNRKISNAKRIHKTFQDFSHAIYHIVTTKHLDCDLDTRRHRMKSRLILYTIFAHLHYFNKDRYTTLNTVRFNKDKYSSNLLLISSPSLLLQNTYCLKKFEFEHSLWHICSPGR